MSDGIQVADARYLGLLDALDALAERMRTIAEDYQADPDEVARARGDVWHAAMVSLNALLAAHRTPQEP